MNFRNKKLLVVGHLALDIVEINGQENRYWGGAGYHAALAAALYLPKKRVVLKSIAGKDLDFDSLIKSGVDISQVKVSPAVNSDRHQLSVADEERFYRSHGNLSEDIRISDINIAKAEIGWIHLASSPPRQQMGWIGELTTMGWSDIPRSCDTFDPFAIENPGLVRGVMEQCTMAFVNEIEWQAIGGKNVSNCLVLKHSKNGAGIYREGKKIVEVSVSQIEALDTTGAGEVLAGVFLASMIQGASEKEAMTEACRAATISVTDLGTGNLKRKLGF